MHEPNSILFLARRDELRESRIRNWRKIVWSSGIFLVVVAGALVGSHLRLKANDPWKSPVLKEQKELLRRQPKDENVKQRIRDLDLQLRRRYFRILSFNASGIWLLLGGMTLFAVASGRLAILSDASPAPHQKSEAAATFLREQRQSRWAVSLAAGAVTVGLAAVTFAKGTLLPRERSDWDRLIGGSDGEGVAAETAGLPSRFELQANWHRFLGFEGNAMAGTNASVAVGDAPVASVAWKTPIPLPGFNSPIVWEGRVFLSGADKAHREVFCFDARSGQLLWRQPVEKVPGSPPSMPELPEMTGNAASSVAADGRNVYAMFPNGDVVAFSMEGRLVWSKNLGLPENMYGHTASLVTWRDRLIIQLDQGEPENNKSKLIAINGRNGQILWQRPRPVGSSWSTPTAFEANGRAQIVALAVPWAIGYSAADGAELWRVDGFKGEITPSPVSANGWLLAISPSEKLMCIRTDGSGDVTGSHVVWSYSDNVPDVTSPVSNGELAFTITTGGVLTCLDMKDGKKVWEKDLDTDFHASPALVGNLMLLLSQKGLVLVLEAGRSFREIHRASLPDEFHASPAIVRGSMFLRGQTNLWRLRQSSANAAAAIQPREVSR